jgi:L-ribulose-5-phosphate 3-epimerase
MNPISFMTANYVARQLNYHMPGGWGQGDKATNDAFRPLPTFARHFSSMLADIRALGFTAIDLWLAHLNPEWLTPDHVTIARNLLTQHNLPVLSLAGWFGSTRDEFLACCRLAVDLNTNILGGTTSLLEKDRAFVVATLQEHGLKLGLENHPEKNPGEMRAKIGDGGNGTIGTAVDTGWYGTQGYDAAQAIAELGDYLFHIHLKDVLAPGAHDSCLYGQGVVPIERCVQTLRRLGYQGPISVEHEPDEGDPGPVCQTNHTLLQQWLH